VPRRANNYPVDAQSDGLAEREWDHIGAAGDVPPPVVTCHHFNKPVPSHGNKCQLDAFVEGSPAKHHIDVLATAFGAPASVLVHLSRRGLSMAPFRRERYLCSCGSTIWITSEALGLESRVEKRATKVQRGRRRTVPVNEDELRVGLPDSTKTTSSPQTMKPAAEAVAAERLKSHDHMSGVVASRLGFSTERENTSTHIQRKVHSSSVTGSTTSKPAHDAVNVSLDRS
jgi:hypothetical protein